MANLSDKINAARQEGYSDEEIITHLSSTDLRSKIDAAKQEGYSATEIADHLSGGQSSAPVSGLLDQFIAGMESNIELPGQTIEAFGKTAGSEGLQGAGKWLRDFSSQPDNFVSASDRFMRPQQGDSYVDPILGFGWGNAPGALAEVTGRAAGDAVLSAGGGMAAGPVGAIGAPAMMEFMRAAGPIAMARAKEQGLDAPTWKDWEIAAGAAGLSGVLNGIGIKGIGILNKGVKEIGTNTATQVVGNVAKETGKKALKEGVTEAGQSVIEQGGSTIGTPGGLKIDLKQAVGEGILGAGAGGMIDAGRNIRPTVSAVNDIRSVDAAMLNNPDAQVQAEVTQKINNIADRMAGAGKAPVSKEINDSVANLRNQIVETLKNQNLSTEDKKAIENGLKTASGLDNADVEAIAGRSENPAEIKALIRKIQVVREMTVQKQSNKGWRGWAAMGASTLGGAAGGLIGSHLMGPFGAAAGAGWGANIGRDLARKLRGNQTQGNNIDKLVGKTQARRAKLLLDRYGPSQATEALNTLTEKAAVNKAQKEKAAQEAKDWQATLDQMKFASDMRKNAREQWENAPPGQAKAKAKAKLDETNLKTREERFKALANRAVQSKIRTESMVNKLEAEKSINALRVEKAQIEKDLAEATAKDTATASKAKADSKVLDLQGKLLKLVDDIKLREEAIAKAKAVTKRAEKIAARVPEATTAAEAMARKSAREYAKMTSKQIAAVKTDQFGNPILDGANYQQQAERIAKLESDGLAEAAALPDKELGNTFIRAIRDFQTYRGRKNQAKRMAIYETVINEVSQTDLDAMRFVMLYIRPLAFAFDAETSMSGSGTADFGTTNGPGEDPPF